jgi:large subunit ribosomal protein L9
MKGLDMKVLLLEDVYNLGRAGDVKKVADGYGRNYLLPQKLAILATPGALKQAELIRTQADAKRAVLNQELGGIAEQLAEMVLTFPARASETGKLYGSVTTQMISQEIQEKYGFEIDRRQLDTQPIRSLGEHQVRARLTVDLIPEFTVIVFREGESVEEQALEAEAEVEAEEAAEEVAEIEGEIAVDVEAEAETEAEVEETFETEAEVDSEILAEEE